MKVLLVGLAVLATSAPAFVDVFDWDYRDRGTGTLLTNDPPSGRVAWRVAEGMHTVRSVTGDFASGVLFEGDVYSAQLAPGVHTYYCEIHEWMRGLVVVG